MKSKKEFKAGDRVHYYGAFNDEAEDLWSEYYDTKPGANAEPSQRDENAELMELLKEAAEPVCSLLCPSHWQGERPPHSDLCQHIERLASYPLKPQPPTRAAAVRTKNEKEIQNEGLREVQRQGRVHGCRMWQGLP